MICGSNISFFSVFFLILIYTLISGQANKAGELIEQLPLLFIISFDSLVAVLPLVGAFFISFCLFD